MSPHGSRSLPLEGFNLKQVTWPAVLKTTFLQGNQGGVFPQCSDAYDHQRQYLN